MYGLHLALALRDRSTLDESRCEATILELAPAVETFIVTLQAYG